MELLSYYGLFLAKTVTIVLAVIAIAIVIANLAMRRRGQSGQLELTHLGERYLEMKDDMLLAKMKQPQKKLWQKERKKKQKQEAKSAKQGMNHIQQKPTLFVIDFRGSMDAHEVSSLREEVSAVLAVAKAEDEVLLRLESPGGVVHGYGLASSQLQRLRDKKIRLTVAVVI